MKAIVPALKQQGLTGFSLQFLYLGITEIAMGEKVLAHHLSVEAYLTYEKEADIRHEYHNGEIFAMAGGTRNHGSLGNAINTELNLICRNRSCVPFNGDVKIRIEASNRFLYPEASVVCGTVISSEQDAESIVNPILIAEVLSDSTEAYDRGEKFRIYKNLASFKEYLLIDQKRPIVTIFFRKDEMIWEMRDIIGLDQTIFLQSLESEIKMEDLYRNVTGLIGPFEEHESSKEKF
ncbi:MAG: Uma2 family endonuclease [Bacteroidota bacterium]